MNEYKLYQNYLGPILEFLYKYLDLDIMERLKGISLLCGMEYSSPYIYDIKFYISRYDHSLNVALITWYLTKNKCDTLAALFHDISSPAFSHVVDYMNKDYYHQESTEELTEEILLSSPKLSEYLKEDGLSIEDVMQFKNFSIVDQDRPSLCADRLDGNISAGMNWCNIVDYNLAKSIIDDVYVSINEYGKEEITFKTESVAQTFKTINDTINSYTHTPEDFYMMKLLADILKDCIMFNLFTYKDLYYSTENEIIDIIEENVSIDEILEYKWILFKTIKEIPKVDLPKIKDKVIDPLVHGYRLSKH